jgi:hypothetical protein
MPNKTETQRDAEAARRDAKATQRDAEAARRDAEAERNETGTDSATARHDGGNPREARAVRDERFVGDDRSLSTLLSSLTNDLSTLVSEEFALARSEAKETQTQMIQGLVSFGTAVVVAISGFTILLTAAVDGLNYVLWPWLSALIIGVLFCGIGLMLMLIGRSRLKAQNMTPDRTIRSVKQNRDLAKEHVT